MISDRIQQNKVLLPINHKNKKISEKRKNSQVMGKKGKIEIKVVISWSLLKVRMQLLIEPSNDILSGNKLSDNNLASELVENRRILNQSQWKKL